MHEEFLREFLHVKTLIKLLPLSYQLILDLTPLELIISFVAMWNRNGVRWSVFLFLETLPTWIEISLKYNDK